MERTFIKFRPDDDILLLQNVIIFNPFEDAVKWINVQKSMLFGLGKRCTMDEIKFRVYSLLDQCFKTDEEAIKRYCTPNQYNAKLRLMNCVKNFYIFYIVQNPALNAVNQGLPAPLPLQVRTTTEEILRKLAIDLFQTGRVVPLDEKETEKGYQLSVKIQHPQLDVEIEAEEEVCPSCQRPKNQENVAAGPSKINYYGASGSKSDEKKGNETGENSKNEVLKANAGNVNIAKVAFNYRPVERAAVWKQEPIKAETQSAEKLKAIAKKTQADKNLALGIDFIGKEIGALQSESQRDYELRKAMQGFIEAKRRAFKSTKFDRLTSRVFERKMRVWELNLKKKEVNLLSKKLKIDARRQKLCEQIFTLERDHHSKACGMMAMSQKFMVELIEQQQQIIDFCLEMIPEKKICKGDAAPGQSQE